MYIYIYIYIYISGTTFEVSGFFILDVHNINAFIYNKQKK